MPISQQLCRFQALPTASLTSWAGISLTFLSNHVKLPNLYKSWGRVTNEETENMSVLWVCYGHTVGVLWVLLGQLWNKGVSLECEIRPCCGWICAPPLQPAQETFCFISISLKLFLP